MGKALFSPRQEQIVLGTTLGDGYLRMGKSSANARLETKSKDRDYIFWKYRELFSTGLFSHPPKIRPLGAWLLYSKCHPIFTELRSLFYPKGRKIVPPEVLENLEPLGLAVWYMDDGSLNPLIRKSRPGKVYPRVFLCTDNFSHEENKLIRTWLESRFHLRYVTVGGVSGSPNRYRIRILGNNGVNALMKVVGPYVIYPMSRKFRMVKP